MYSISHDREDESPEAKARWFRSLSMEERLRHFDEFTEMLLALDPGLIRKKDAQSIPGRVRVLSLE
ncbi:MAG: hypothetical protein ACKV2U_19955 [Bryobacteraceae bacterium]